MAQKGKCQFGPRCEFFHDAETGFARTPLTKKTRQPHRENKREYRRRGGSDSECNDSGDTDYNRSYNEYRSNSHRNGSTLWVRMDWRGGLEWKAVHISTTSYCWMRPRTLTLPCWTCV